MQNKELAKKEHAVYRSLLIVNKAIESMKHGNRDHFTTTDQVWPYLIYSLVCDFNLDEFSDPTTGTNYPLMSGNESTTMDSLFGMGRIFLGGVSATGIKHATIMRQADIGMIHRFSTFAQNYMIKKEWTKRRKKYAKG
jgi:hypothetical protein